MVIKMNPLDPLDPEAQFYPFISLTLRGNENPMIIQYCRIISFYEDSIYPPVLSSIWNPPNIALKK
jgi:hypothetical protein